MENLTYVIDLSDLRMTYLYDELWGNGFNAKKYKAGEAYLGKLCYCFSPAKKFTREEIEQFAPNSILCCGKTEFVDLLLLKNIDYINLMEDEFYNMKNAKLTAEATLMLAIQNTISSVFDLKFLILGYGRVGKCTAEIFKQLGLNFDIATNDIKEQILANVVTCNIYEIMPPLNFYDCIINTVPANIFAAKSIGEIKTSCLFIDIASECVMPKKEQLTLPATYMHQTSLPGKYTPYSAGLILKQTILKRLKEKNKILL